MGILNRSTPKTDLVPTNPDLAPVVATESKIKDVAYACLHGSIFVPNLGQFGPTLTLGAGSTISKVSSMAADNTFLTVKIQDPAKGSATLLIPLTNVTHMKLK